MLTLKTSGKGRVEGMDQHHDHHTWIKIATSNIIDDGARL